jgi:glucokinase
VPVREGAAVGVDVGGTKCLGVAIVDGDVAADARRSTPSTGDEVVAVLAELVGWLAQEVGEPITAVGVGMPGLVDGDGVLRFAPNLLGAVGLPVRRRLGDRLGVQVEVDNDATCAAWGEQQLGAARGLDHVILVTLGTGIGGGIVTDGRLHRGANRFAGEIGHMVVDPDGPACPCGRRGCWERFASGPGLAMLARQAAEAGAAQRVLALADGDPAQVRGEHVTAALAEGDREAAAIVDDFARWVALGLGNLANVFDPEAFVLSGGLVTVGGPLFEPVRTAFHGQVEAEQLRPEIAILPAVLGDRAGAIGAALLPGSGRR